MFFRPLTAAILAAHDRVTSVLKNGNLTTVMSQGTKGLYLLLGISPNHVLTLIYSEKADPQQIFTQDMPIINLIVDELMIGQD